MITMMPVFGKILLGIFLLSITGAIALWLGVKQSKTDETKRVLNIIHALLQTAVLAMLYFLPLAAFREETHYNVYGHLVQGSAGYIYYRQMLEGMPIFGLIATGLLVCGILVAVISAIRNAPERDGKLHSILPIFIFLFVWMFVAWLGPYNVDGVSGCYVDSLHTETMSMPIWNVIQIMLLASIVLGFVKRSKMLVPDQAAAAAQVGTPELDKGKELKMYKELLDQGVITQEDFEAKKKQILGL